MKSREFFDDYVKSFLNQNSKLNLISKNDEKFLWEKHIFDSLSIEKFFEHGYEIPQTLLDIGTGGGFPSVPVALAYPQVKVYALDSIRKKISAIENIKSDLEIENLFPICERAENLKVEYENFFDVITCRAVAPLKVISNYAFPLLKTGGFFVAYKSLRVDDEIEDAKEAFKKLSIKVTEVIKYKLPTEENHDRNLVVMQRK